jgi:hypothetical protein
MNITTITESVNKMLESSSIPALALPPFLLKCVSLKRPGLSAYKIATKVIENNKVLGIPTDPNPDGSPNLINQYTYNLVSSIVDAIKNDAQVQIAIPMESLLINATGANAGGPVTCVGTNLMDSISRGIIT